MSTTTIANTRYLEVTHHAANLTLALRDNRTSAGHESSRMLTAAENELHEAHRLKNIALVHLAAMREARRVARLRVSQGLRAALMAGKLFDDLEMTGFRIDYTALDRSLAELEQRFSAKGELGRQFAGRLHALANELEQAVVALAEARSRSEAAARDFSVAYYRLTGAVALAKAVLRSQGVPLPRAPQRARQPKKLLPALTVPVNDTVRLAPAPQPFLTKTG